MADRFWVLLTFTAGVEEIIDCFNEDLVRHTAPAIDGSADSDLIQSQQPWGDTMTTSGALAFKTQAPTRARRCHSQ